MAVGGREGVGLRLQASGLRHLTEEAFSDVLTHRVLALQAYLLNAGQPRPEALNPEA